MNDIVWEEPPGGKSSYAKWVATVDELRANPGRWALIATDISLGTADHLRKRYALEVTVRGARNGRAEKVYARWPEVTP